MKKFITSFLICAMIVVSIPCMVAEAFIGKLYHDPNILRAMEADPTHYYYGHGLGPGAGTYVDVNTIGVEIYNPPEYLISYDTIHIRYPGYPKIKLTGKVKVRLYYNYDKQEAYYETENREGKLEWIYIEPEAPHSMAYEADMVFSIAYGMHFYKNSKYHSGYLKGLDRDAQDFVKWEYDNTGMNGHSFK